MQLNGARILIECLIREGVNIIFGYPGGSVLDIYDELPQYGEQLRHVLVRHEQAAVHMADGLARATGEVGVVMATSGPGATNTVTGIATAYCDSIPMVIFTGQVPTGLIGNDAFQEVDIAGITRPCTKHNYVVKDVKDLAKVVRQAFYLARSGRPGPVLVDLPKNVLQGSAEFVWPEDVSLRSYNPTYRPNYAQIRKVVDALYNAERPLLFGGGGVIMSNASEEFRNLAKNLSIPVTCSLMGLGAFPCDHPQWLGMLGMHGTYAANKAVSNADLLIAVGVRFDDRVTGRLSSFGAISTSSQATATKEAALAAYPSTWATIRAGWFRMAASMARAANTSPPANRSPGRNASPHGRASLTNGSKNSPLPGRPAKRRSSRRKSSRPWTKSRKARPS